LLTFDKTLHWLFFHCAADCLVDKVKSCFFSHLLTMKSNFQTNVHEVGRLGDFQYCMGSTVRRTAV